MKLGEIYSSSSFESAVEFYNKAIACANTMDETFYIISANTALGDLYYNKKEDEKAYKNYKIAYELTKDSKYSDNVDKISNRINDIKMRVGEERFSHFE